MNSSDTPRPRAWSHVALARATRCEAKGNSSSTELIRRDSAVQNFLPFLCDGWPPSPAVKPLHITRNNLFFSYASPGMSVHRWPRLKMSWYIHQDGPGLHRDVDQVSSKKPTRASTRTATRLTRMCMWTSSVPTDEKVHMRYSQRAPGRAGQESSPRFRSQVQPLGRLQRNTGWLATTPGQAHQPHRTSSDCTCPHNTQVPIQ